MIPMVRIAELNRRLREFQDSPRGFGHELRMNVAEIVMRNLKQKPWTQRELAEAAGKGESYITRIVHGQQNCSLDTVGALLYALGVRASIVEDAPAKAVGSVAHSLTLDTTHGQEEIVYQEDLKEDWTQDFRFQSNATAETFGVQAAAHSDPVRARVG